MINCYSIHAETCFHPYGTVDINHLNKEKAELLFTVLSGAFRQVRIMDDTTGEVMRECYVGDDFWTKVYEVSEAMAKVEAITRER